MARPLTPIPIRLLPLLLAAWPAAAQTPPAAPTAPRDPVAAARCAGERPAFGCANSANLQAMAAPDDLVGGRPLGPSRGALEAAAVARLESDKVKDLLREGTQSAGGGGPK